MTRKPETTALAAGQRWMAGRATVRVLSISVDGKVWFVSDIHPSQAMQKTDFMAWIRSVGATLQQEPRDAR